MLHRYAIATQTQARNTAAGHRTHVAVLANGPSGRNITEVYFQNGTGQHRHRVRNGQRGMGVGGGVKYDPGTALAQLLKGFHEGALRVVLLV